MFRLLEEHGRSIGSGHLKGKLFLVDRYPGAIESTCPNDWVYGELYEFPNSNAILERLDEYEECGPKFPQPSLYRREQKPVVMEDGTAVNAWVYIYNRPTDALPEIQCGDFLSYVNKEHV